MQGATPNKRVRPESDNDDEAVESEEKAPGDENDIEELDLIKLSSQGRGRGRGRRGGGRGSKQLVSLL